jgi:hypothetical protein
MDAPGSDAEWVRVRVCGSEGANLSKEEFPRLLPCHWERLKTRSKQIGVSGGAYTDTGRWKRVAILREREKDVASEGRRSPLAAPHRETEN